MRAVAFRDAIPPKAYDSVLNTELVLIRHPGYLPPNILAAFLATDQVNDRRGIHYIIIRTALEILVGPLLEGWLSQHKDAESSRILLADDDLLPAGEYYYHLPDCEHPYAVFPNFEHWEFPHGGLPKAWIAAAPSSLSPGNAPPAAVTARNGSCRITLDSDGCEYAHLIPAKESEWFGENEMIRYAGEVARLGNEALKSPCNLILLRADLHRVFDEMKMSFVVKGSSLRIHVHSESPQLRSTYHNRAMQHLQEIPIEFFFARFAWDIFPFLRTFLQNGRSRWLNARGPNGERAVRLYSPEECRQFIEGRDSNRSASPAKRPRSSRNGSDAGVSTQEVDCRSVVSAVSRMTSLSDQWSDGSPDGQRGRKRRRSIDTWVAAQHCN